MSRTVLPISHVRLRTQLLLATVAISFVLTAAGLLVVQRSMRSQVRRQTAIAVTSAIAAFQKIESKQQIELSRTAALLAELPTLKAVMTTRHAVTIQDTSAEFWTLSGSDVLVLATPNGRVMAVHANNPGLSTGSAEKLLAASLAGHEQLGWWQDGSEVIRVVLRPIIAGAGQDKSALGVLVVGRRINVAVAQEIASFSGSDLALISGHTVIASTLTAAARQQLNRQLASLAVADSPRQLMLSGRPYEAAAVDLPAGSAVPIHALLLVPLGNTYALMDRLTRTNITLGVVAVLLGALLVTVIAGAITHPLEDLVAAVRALAAGDESYQLQPRGSPEVAELATAFLSMRKQLRDSQQRQLDDERLAALGRAAGSISHDLRHHLAAVVANAEFLHDSARLGYDPDETYREIERASQEMTALIDSLVEIGRDRRTLVLTEGKLDEVVEKAVGAVRSSPEFRGRQVEIVVQTEAAGTFDLRKLERALFNLILNACQATDAEAGHVRVSISGSAEHIECRVSDNGTGIPAEIRERLFEPFVSSGKNNGTGLGLAIASKIVGDHGGTIEIEQTSSQGTTFLIRLPRQPAGNRSGAESVLT